LPAHGQCLDARREPSRSDANYFLSYIGDYQMYGYLDEAALARGHYVYEPYRGDPVEQTEALRALYPSES